ncbi:FBP domain-containing protein [Kineosporia sp. J2-2]|uniref:FBP domain-containing protein n=1 Tax=Kineosporia corallincola TaxID=2835133 RepID=A0ABS5TE89_9ACTN|nr:FBP domain-containing protein [Kineosporia corallincola]MBT0769381.1 FBP domain-containing protein [Kineosporia corallincola]
MHPITEKQIRTSFVNSTLRERRELTLPDDFADLDWDNLDYLGWRDRKFPNQGYVFAEIDDRLVGVIMRRSDAVVRRRAQCNWCEDVLLPNDVVFFSARRAGQAGRNGNTLGTLVCSGFECPANVRVLPPPAYEGFDREAARQQRIEALQLNVYAFVSAVLAGE